MQFLMGLNDSFPIVRAQILLTNPLLSINKVFSLIVQEERQREITINSLSHDTTALMTRTFMPNPATSSMPNPHASSIPNPHEPSAFMTKTTSAIPGSRFFKQNYKNGQPICSHCGVASHNIEKCYRVHGYPPGFKFTRNKSNQSV
jgi:hypothetical protein